MPPPSLSGLVVGLCSQESASAPFGTHGTTLFLCVFDGVEGCRAKANRTGIGITDVEPSLDILPKLTDWNGGINGFDFVNQWFVGWCFFHNEDECRDDHELDQGLFSKSFREEVRRQQDFHTINAGDLFHLIEMCGARATEDNKIQIVFYIPVVISLNKYFYELPNLCICYHVFRGSLCINLSLVQILKNSKLLWIRRRRQKESYCLLIKKTHFF